MKTLVTLLLATILCYQSIAQEIQAKVTVNAVNMASTVNRKLFTTLQASLVNFINNRKWTDKNYATNEKITCNFTISILKNPEPDVYVGTIAVQAARPVYNSSYTSPLINFVDEIVVF